MRRKREALFWVLALEMVCHSIVQTPIEKSPPGAGKDWRWRRLEPSG